MNIKKFMPVFSFFAGWITLAAMPPWNFWPASIIGLSAFYIILQNAGNKKQGFLCGWLFAMGYFLPGLSWIANALLVEGNDFKWVWPFAIAGLPVLLSLFYGYAAALYVLLRSKAASWPLFIALITLTEWIRGHIFTGFPWNLFGYSWSAIPEVMQVVSIGGIYFLSLLTIIWCSTPALLCCRKTPRNLKIIIAILSLFTATLSYSYGYFRLKNNPTSFRDDVAVILIQPNIAQEDKWNPEKLSENINTLLRLSEKHHVDNGMPEIPVLLVWPETAITYNIYQQSSVQNAIKAVLSEYPEDSVLITGMLRNEKKKNQTQYYNSLVSINKKGNIHSIYNKTHLVPFGEYIPLKNYIPFNPFAFYEGFTKGNGSMPMDIGNKIYINPQICYEIVFPGETKTRNTKSPSDIIVNVTNDAWYGDSSGPIQHFAKARYRAIETGLPVIRVANTGISGIIDPMGRVTVKIPLMSEKNTYSRIPEALRKKSLYPKLKELVYLLGMITMFFLCFFDRLCSRYRRNI